jgi:hypothetical protein
MMARSKAWLTNVGVVRAAIRATEHQVAVVVGSSELQP